MNNGHNSDVSYAYGHNFCNTKWFCQAEKCAGVPQIAFQESKMASSKTNNLAMATLEVRVSLRYSYSFYLSSSEKKMSESQTKAGNQRKIENLKKKMKILKKFKFLNFSWFPAFV